MFEIEVPESQDIANSVIEAKLTYFDLLDKTNKEVIANIQIPQTSQLGELNLDVDKQKNRVLTIDALDKVPNNNG